MGAEWRSSRQGGERKTRNCQPKRRAVTAEVMSQRRKEQMRSSAGAQAARPTQLCRRPECRRGALRAVTLLALISSEMKAAGSAVMGEGKQRRAGDRQKG